MEVIVVESPKFKHQQVEADIRRMVEGLPVGTRLPAERGLAEQYGCNFLTVRRALKQLVDDGTVVRRIGSGTFVAKHTSREMPSRKVADRLGVLVWRGGDAYANRVLEGIASGAAGLKVDLRSSWIQDFATDGLSQARQLEEEGCAAIILPWFPHDRVEEVRAFVRNCTLPVGLPMVVPGLEANCFESQEIFGDSLRSLAEQLCGYFHALGHRRIAMIGPDAPGDLVLNRFLSAYACYTSRANLPNHCGLVGSGAQAMNQVAERWAAYRGDLAVVSYDDEHALRFLTAMHKLGMNAPEDFVILGYNDIEASAYSDPPLSTVSQNFNYIGHWLVKSALGLGRGALDQSRTPPRPQLIVRSTCGGHGRIDETFRTRLPGLDVIVAEDSGRG
jgi:DNA-binding LacI/PurR family transcriptional regulator